ncbi:MAG: hypothetical protein ABR887_05935 [Methanoregulaceae archaeon]
MLDLFWNMMKEEWRVHSTMFGSISFALFPIMIFAIAFMGSFLLPVFKSVLPIQDMLIITHGNFLLLGLMVGAFGLLGNEVMNRRFGQASLLAYSSRSLPLSERFIFANFVVKDTVYYFVFWVFPFIAGFALATPFTHISPIYPLILSVTLTSSFLFGLSGVFFLSTIYVRSKRVLGIVLVLILVIFVFAYKFAGISVTSLFPPLILFYSFSWTNLIITCAVIIIPFIISIALFIPEFTDTTKRYRNMLTSMTRKLWFFPYPPFSAKDLIDMHRSGSVVGQTIFSFIIPLALIWFFLSALTGFLPAYGIFLQFTVLTGVIASTMYTWLTQFDSFTSYSCLPVSVKTVIASKINSFTVLQLIPIAFISFVSFTTHNVPYLLPALVLCISISFYALSVIVYMTGLSPNVLLYDVKVLFVYLISVGFPVLVLGALSFINPNYALGSVLLFLPTLYLIKLGFTKWDVLDQPIF